MRLGRGRARISPSVFALVRRQGHVRPKKKGGGTHSDIAVEDGEAIVDHAKAGRRSEHQ
jgi:hypothetical protein